MKLFCKITELELASGGIALGLAGSYAMTRVLRCLLLRISPTDPLAFAIMPILMECVVLVACCLPAWRVSRVDPMAASRTE
jgi:ABC-type lipoprotein release transport system permease subunit